MDFQQKPKGSQSNALEPRSPFEANPRRSEAHAPLGSGPPRHESHPFRPKQTSDVSLDRSRIASLGSGIVGRLPKM